MKNKVKNIIIFLWLIFTVSSFYIIPLRAGTIKITDQQLRFTKRIQKNVNIQLLKDQYLEHKDIQTIASITSLAIDQYLNFYFLYDIICPNESCFLNFTLIRRTQQMNDKFQYHISVDYLIARGLKIYDVNVTEYQTHVFLGQIKSFNQQNQIQTIKKIPRNNADAWHMLMFPAGFSNITLSGKVIYNYVLSDDLLYVIHYNNHENGNGQDNHMGWVEDFNNILYRVVFVPPSYLKAADCLPTDKSHLLSKYTLQCNGKNSVKWFYGFKGTCELQMQGQFFDLKSGFSFSLANSPSDYNLVAFPFEANDKFIDQRVHQYKWDVQKQETKQFIGWFLIFILVIVLVVAYTCAQQKYVRQAKKAFKKLSTFRRKSSDEQLSSSKRVENNIML